MGQGGLTAWEKKLEEIHGPFHPRYANGLCLRAWADNEELGIGILSGITVG
jgi:hypothetical protein